LQKFLKKKGKKEENVFGKREKKGKEFLVPREPSWRKFSEVFSVVPLYMVNLSGH
jgi:hypothetical protein